MSISKEFNQQPAGITLDQLIQRLQNLRGTYPGDYRIHFCTEHKILKGTQLQEPIKDLAVSKRTGVVILLAESFK